MSCDDFVVSRRRFLAGTTALLGGVAVSGMVGDIFTQTAYGAPGLEHPRGAQPAGRQRRALPGRATRRCRVRRRPAHHRGADREPAGQGLDVRAASRAQAARGDVEVRQVRRGARRRHAGAQPQPLLGHGAGGGRRPRLVGPGRLAQPDDRQSAAGQRGAGGPAPRQQPAAHRPGRAGVGRLDPAAGRPQAARRQRGRRTGPDAGALSAMWGESDVGHRQGGPGGAQGDPDDAGAGQGRQAGERRDLPRQRPRPGAGVDRSGRPRRTSASRW